MADFDKVIYFEKFNASAFYNKGICLSNFKNYREAKKAFQFAVKLNPKNEVYYHTLGNCLRKMKKHKEAIEMYEKGKEIKKNKDNKNINEQDLNINAEEDDLINKININNLNKINFENKNIIFRKTKTMKEINKCNIENNVNETGLVSHIKEVLKGDSINKLVKKLDFSKAVMMKHKLDKFNKK